MLRYGINTVEIEILNILKWHGVEKSQYFKVLKFILKKIKVWYDQ
jgi:hypothetical protein